MAELQQRRSRTGAAVGVGLTLALLLGACSTNREVTTPEPVPVTEELLEASLLTEDDLPAGWTAGDGAPVSTEVIPGHDCDEALTKLSPKVEASVSFTNANLTLTDTTASFPGQGRAAEKVHRDLLEDCRSIVLADQGLAVRTASLRFGVLSDDTLPIRIEFEPTSGAIGELDVIVMRRGDLLRVIRLEGPRPSDKALLDATVRVALGRLGGVHLDTT